jgi:hypothetical protein
VEENVDGNSVAKGMQAYGIQEAAVWSFSVNWGETSNSKQNLIVVVFVWVWIMEYQVCQAKEFSLNSVGNGNPTVRIN